MENWNLLFATTNRTEASIVQGMLEENQVPVQVLNKTSSSYLNFGEIEIYVPAHFKEIARDLINKSLLN